MITERAFKNTYMTQAPQGLRDNCRCARCNCLRLAEPGTPMTLAETWLTKRSWNPEHQDRTQRDRFNLLFGSTILNSPTLQELTAYGPLLEINAGTGYWSMELQNEDVDIIPVDHSPNSNPWTRIRPITGRQAMLEYPDRSIMLHWPPGETWPRDMLRTFQGRHIILVGENQPENPPAGYRLARTIRIPNFTNTRDQVRIWTREAAAETQ